MSFEALQERLAALQATTAQLQELIDRLSNLKFQPGSVPLGVDEDSSVSGELSAEISQILREEEDELELLLEEAEDLRGGRPGSDAEHHKARLKDGVDRLQRELRRYADCGHLCGVDEVANLLLLQLPSRVSQSPAVGETKLSTSPESRT
jgi:hypothetical protein